MKKILLIAVLISVMFSGCSETENDIPVISTEPVKVEIIIPDQISAHQAFNIQAKVIQADEPVNDADEVVFEYWKGGTAEDAHEKVEAKLKENGVYEIETTLKAPGTYYAISHVQARHMHTMPKKEFVVNE